MLQSIAENFATAGLLPLGYCLSWHAGQIGLRAGADVVLGLSLLMIPVAQLVLLRNSSDVLNRRLSWLFAAFIAAVGISQFVALVTIWVPVWGLANLSRVVAAAAAAWAAIYFWRSMPTLLSMPGPAAHAVKEAELNAEIARRRQAEAALSVALSEVNKINAELEQRVAVRTADLRAANEELERFAYIASHDLRAPLRALMTVPEWLRDTLVECYGAVEPRLENDLHEMELQAGRMDRLLTDLLTYARIGQSGEALQVIDPAGPIRESAQLSGMPEGFEVTIGEPLPRVRCIPAEFALVMRNLISNAIKHHDRDTGCITVTGHDCGALAVLEVRDDGPGIAQKYSERIFEMFSTLRPRDEVEGSGMGLAMVKKIMERAGGWVRLGETGGGRGAVFELAFPTGCPDKVM